MIYFLEEQACQPPKPAGAFIVAEGWGHCFVGSKESTVRWVMDRSSNKLVAAQIHLSLGWKNLSEPDIADIQESVNDNNIPVEFEDYDLEVRNSLPQWAIHRA